MKSEEEMRKLVDAVRELKPLEPSRKPPPLFWVYAVLLVLFLIYCFARFEPGKPMTRQDMKALQSEMRQDEARKNLEQTTEAYRRTLSENQPP